MLGSFLLSTPSISSSFAPPLGSLPLSLRSLGSDRSCATPFSCACWCWCWLRACCCRARRPGRPGKQPTFHIEISEVRELSSDHRSHTAKDMLLSCQIHFICHPSLQQTHQKNKVSYHLRGHTNSFLRFYKLTLICSTSLQASFNITRFLCFLCAPMAASRIGGQMFYL